MREKHPFIVLSFQTTVAAMEWEKRCMETGIPGRLIPLPREISAGCVALKRITLKAENTIKKII